MKKEPVELPQEMIISITWKSDHIIKFLQRLSKGSIFGYSGSFTSGEIENLAWRNGVEVKLLPKSSALRKKYGEYVLRVNRPYTRSTEPIRAHFEDIYYMERKHSPGNRKCSGYTGPSMPCPNLIFKGEEFLEITDLKELHTGRKAYVKRSLCGECAEVLIKGKVAELLRVLTRSNGAIDPIIRAVRDL